MYRARADLSIRGLFLLGACTSLWLTSCFRDVSPRSRLAGQVAIDARAIVIDSSVTRDPITVRLTHGSDIIAWPQYSHGPLLVWQQGSWHRNSVPESVRVVARAGIRGDSVWVYDADARAVVIRNRRGQWSEQFVPTLVAGYVQSIVGVLEDGSSVFVSGGRRHDGQAGRAYVWVANGQNLIVLDSLTLPPATMSLPSRGGGFVRLEQPWRSRDFITVASNRRGVLVIKTSTRSSDTATVVIVRYQTPGFAASRYAIHLPLWALTTDDVQQWKTETLTDSLLARLGGASAASVQLDSNLYRPTYLPPIAAAVELDDRTLLFERPAPGRGRIWQLYRTDGELVAETVPRASWRLFDAGNGVALFGTSDRPAVSDTVFAGRFGRAYRTARE